MPFLSGMLGWYRVDAVATGTPTVAAWPDASGNGITLTQTGAACPLYVENAKNTQSVLRFDGVDDQLTGVPTTQCGTVITAFCPKTIPTSGTGTGPAFLNVTPQGTNVRFYLRMVYSTPGQLQLCCETSSQLLTVPTYTCTANTWCYLTLIKSSTGALEAYANGTRYLNTTFTLGGPQTGANPTGMLGGDANGYLNMDLGELLIYNRVLTAGERQQLESYLKTKYGL